MGILGICDQGQALAVAYGAATEETLEMQIGVPPLIPLADSPEFNEQSNHKWEDWIEKHFQMREESGNIIRLRRIGTSVLFVAR